MPTELILTTTPHEDELALKRSELTVIRSTLAEREQALADLRIALKIFESRYMQAVGVLYATLDDWHARIYEREVVLYDSDDARRRAAEARARANETHEAAHAHAAEVVEFDPSPSLKQLFREVAKRIHPDFARDDAEAAHFTRLMALANAAYNRNDAHTLQRLLDDHSELAGTGDGPAAELLRVTRQIQHAQRDIAALDEEERMLAASELAQLRQDTEAAEHEGRDLFAELAASLHEQIAEAEYKFHFVDKQISNERAADA